MISRKTLFRCLAGLTLGCALHGGAALAAADPAKVLHLAFEAADDGFDLIKTNSLYSNWLAEGVFESLLAYDYLARPAKGGWRWVPACCARQTPPSAAVDGHPRHDGRSAGAACSPWDLVSRHSPRHQGRAVHERRPSMRRVTVDTSTG